MRARVSSSLLQKRTGSRTWRMKDDIISKKSTVEDELVKPVGREGARNPVK